MHCTLLWIHIVNSRTRLLQPGPLRRSETRHPFVSVFPTSRQQPEVKNVNETIAWGQRKVLRAIRVSLPCGKFQGLSWKACFIFPIYMFLYICCVMSTNGNYLDFYCLNCPFRPTSQVQRCRNISSLYHDVWGILTYLWCYTYVLGFWWHRSYWFPSLLCYINFGFRRFIHGATPADLLAASMTFSHFLLPKEF